MDSLQKKMTMLQRSFTDGQEHFERRLVASVSSARQMASNIFLKHLRFEDLNAEESSSRIFLTSVLVVLAIEELGSLFVDLFFLGAEYYSAIRGVAAVVFIVLALIVFLLHRWFQAQLFLVVVIVNCFYIAGFVLIDRLSLQASGSRPIVIPLLLSLLAPALSCRTLFTVTSLIAGALLVSFALVGDILGLTSTVTGIPVPISSSSSPSVAIARGSRELFFLCSVAFLAWLYVTLRQSDRKENVRLLRELVKSIAVLSVDPSCLGSILRGDEVGGVGNILGLGELGKNGLSLSEFPSSSTTIGEDNDVEVLDLDDDGQVRRSSTRSRASSSSTVASGLKAGQFLLSNLGPRGDDTRISSVDPGLHRLTRMPSVRAKSLSDEHQLIRLAYRNVAYLRSFIPPSMYPIDDAVQADEQTYRLAKRNESENTTSSALSEFCVEYGTLDDIIVTRHVSKKSRMNDSDSDSSDESTDEELQEDSAKKNCGILSIENRFFLGLSKKTCLTLLLCNIMDFHEYVRVLSPIDICAIHAEYLDTVIECVGRHGGIVHDFSGDKLLASFNSIIKQRHHTLQACRAALRLIHCVKKKRFFSPGDEVPPFRIRVSVVCADVHYGHIGTDAMRRFTIIGEGMKLLYGINARFRDFENVVLCGENAMEQIKYSMMVKNVGIVAVRQLWRRTSSLQLGDTFGGEEDDRGIGGNGMIRRGKVYRVLRERNFGGDNTEEWWSNVAISSSQSSAQGRTPRELYELAMTQVELENVEEARLSMRAYLQINPGDEDARRILRQLNMNREGKLYTSL